MSSSDDERPAMRRGEFLRGMASATLAAGLTGAARAADATPPIPPAPPSGHRRHHHDSTFQIVPARLAAASSMRLARAQQLDLDRVVADIAAAFKSFTASLTDAQRGELLFPLDAPQRISSRDPTLTPSFCAVLAWCIPGWGLTLGSLSFAQRVAFEAFLRSALGAAGYEMASAVRNRQQLIGALESHATTQAVAAALKLDPQREFKDLAALLAGLRAGGVDPPPGPAAIGGMNPGSENWQWAPDGMAERWRQFQDYGIAVFGAPDDATWALRLEGHHLSINLTFIRSGRHWQVHGTPLFLGAFPIVVPPPADPTALGDPLTWQQGQSLGLGLARSCKGFWNALPPDQRAAAWRKPDTFQQRPPLVNETPPAPMLAALEITPDLRLIEQGPHLRIDVARVPAEGQRQMALLFDEMLTPLHPAIAAAYRRRLDAAMHNATILATWAGGDLADQGSPHFSSIALGPFLIELVQGPEYSVSTIEAPWSNHLHVMLRDLASPVWGDPLGDHARHDHA